MARRPLDWEELEGAPSRHTVKLDAGSLEFLHYLGCGDLSVGIREAARIARRTNAAAGELSADYLEHRKKAHPGEVAAYYAAHPDQVETPHRSKYASKASPRALMSTPRTTKGSAAPAAPAPAPYVVLPPPTVYPLEIQQAMDDAERARLAAQAVPPGFEGWD